MTIASLHAWIVRIPLKRKVTHASHSRTETLSVIVRCQLKSGETGWGEGLPRKYVTGETVDDLWPLLREAQIERQLRGGWKDLAEAMALCRSLTIGRPDDDRYCFGNSIRCAVEMALLDAAFRQAGEPLWRIAKLAKIDGLPMPEIQPERIRYSAVFTSMNLPKLMIRCAKLRYYQFAAGKLKVGIAGRDDVQQARWVRRLLGASFDLRIDANEAWLPEQLEERLERLSNLGITSCEQPVAHEHVKALSHLRRRIPVPIMLDESVCSLEDARRAFNDGTCDLFNLRLSKCGGFIPSLELAAFATQHGLGYQLGCQVGETGILSAAGRQFATAVGGIRHHEGSFDRFLVKEPLINEDLTFGRGGWAPRLHGPGLGITVDETSIRRVCVEEQQIL